MPTTTRRVACRTTAIALLILNCDSWAATNNLLSFEGGGFRAMVADSGLMAGALKYNRTHIGRLLSNVDAISGNSGGTWFASCLAYSPDFVASLEDYGHFVDASKGGYMGLVGVEYVNHLRVTNPAHNPLLTNIFDHYRSEKDQLDLGEFLNPSNTWQVLNWGNALSQTVFKPYQTADRFKQTNFYNSVASRTDAVPHQSLVFEIAVSTNGAAIGRYNAGNASIATATNIGLDSSKKPYVFTAAAVTSLGNPIRKVAPPLQTVADGKLDITYSTTPTTNTSKPEPTSSVELNNLRFDGMSVFSATASSSAAAGLLDSAGSVYSNPVTGAQKMPNVLVNNLLNFSQELAIPVAVDPLTGVVTSLPDAADKTAIRVGDKTPDQLQSQPLLRLVDGGYVDNTGVTSGMTYMQANNSLQDGFNITVFSTYQPTTKPDPGLFAINPKYAAFSSGVKNLFTQSAQFQSAAGFSLSHLSTAVFDAGSTTGLDAPVWQYHKPNTTFRIAYYKLGVTTTADNHLGITPGLKGTLNVWEVYTTANTAAWIPSVATWSQYPKLFNELVDGLQTTNNGQVGAALLSQSLGY